MHYTKPIASNSWTLLICLPVFNIRSLVPFRRCGCQCGKQSWHIVVCWNGWMYTGVTGQVRLECLSQTPSSHSVCAIRTPLGVDQKIQERTHAGCMTEGKRTVKQLVWRTYCSFFVLHSEATSMIISQGVWPLKFRSWTFIAVNE